MLYARLFEVEQQEDWRCEEGTADYQSRLGEEGDNESMWVEKSEIGRVVEGATTRMIWWGKVPKSADLVHEQDAFSGWKVRLWE